MRVGYTSILSNALQEIEYASDSANDLKSNKDSKKLWKAWSELLDHYVKAVSAMRRATDQGSSKKWSDSLLEEQRRNKILQYAYQARDNANHVFEMTRRVEEPSVSLGKIIRITGNSRVTFRDNYIVDPQGVKYIMPNGQITTQGGRFKGGNFPREVLKQNEHYLVISEVQTRSGFYDIPNLDTKEENRANEIAECICYWLDKKKNELISLAKEEEKRSS
ncbi:hypothetical protein [Thalassospira xiamenensis]|uniref:Uncharacterized protein n=1 Tax=Thalassospira xiamenensis TaxID=220697 RepID=A0A285U181_9PROT|nr:hypothetical protein [Thalassospira xiamenensis]SOC30101.1 hypothetical protein SAMN05428964_10898 [Thalassospira xiamenensis]